MTIDKKVSNIKAELLDLGNKCEELGMTEISIQKFLVGEDVMDCPYCNTFNMYFLTNNRKQQFDMYKCDNCGNTYMQKYIITG